MKNTIRVEQDLSDFITKYGKEKECLSKAWYVEDFAKAIIVKYPQIPAEKVWEGSKNKMIRDTWAYCGWDEDAEHTDIEIFVSEVGGLK